MFFWDSYQKASLFAGIALVLSIVALFYIGVDRTTVIMAGIFIFIVFFATWVGFAASDATMSVDGSFIPMWSENDPDEKRWNHLINSDPQVIGDQLVKDVFKPIGKVINVTPKRRSTDGRYKRNH